MNKPSPSKTVGIRLSRDDYQALERQADSLKIPPSTFAKELLLNGLYGRREETLLSAFEDSESKMQEQVSILNESLLSSVEDNKKVLNEELLKVNARLDGVELKMHEHLYGVATAVFLFLSKDDEDEEDRTETKEYVRQIFPFWKG